MDDAVLGPHTRAAAAMFRTDERTRKMSTESLLPPPGDPALERLEVLRGEIRQQGIDGGHPAALSTQTLRLINTLADAIDILIEREVRRG